MITFFTTKRKKCFSYFKVCDSMEHLHGGRLNTIDLLIKVNLLCKKKIIFSI